MKTLFRDGWPIFVEVTANGWLAAPEFFWKGIHRRPRPVFAPHWTRLLTFTRPPLPPPELLKVHASSRAISSPGKKRIGMEMHRSWSHSAWPLTFLPESAENQNFPPFKPMLNSHVISWNLATLDRQPSVHSPAFFKRLPVWFKMGSTPPRSECFTDQPLESSFYGVVGFLRSLNFRIHPFFEDLRQIIFRLLSDFSKKWGVITVTQSPMRSRACNICELAKRNPLYL